MVATRPDLRFPLNMHDLDLLQIIIDFVIEYERLTGLVMTPVQLLAALTGDLGKADPQGP